MTPEALWARLEAELLRSQKDIAYAKQYEMSSLHTHLAHREFLLSMMERLVLRKEIPETVWERLKNG